MRRQAPEVRQRAEHGLILRGVVVGDDVGVLRAVAAVLNRTLERPQSLRPKAVLAPVPEQEGRIGCARDGHGAPRRHADTLTERPVVLKLSLWYMTGRAGDRAVGAQARVKEECPAQRSRAGIVGHAI